MGFQIAALTLSFSFLLAHQIKDAKDALAQKSAVALYLKLKVSPYEDVQCALL